MATALDSYFEVDGITLSDRVDILSGVLDPRAGVGTDARMGSMYLRSNGETWKKVGIGTKDWALETGSGSIDDDSMYVEKTRSILVTTDYEVEVDVGIISFNHYYEDGVTCTLQPPNYYQHPITIKNLSGMPIEIAPTVGRVEGSKKFNLLNRYSSVTLSPLQNDWIITASVEGKKMIEDDRCPHCDHKRHSKP
jgi:hypothetical protein